MGTISEEPQGIKQRGSLCSMEEQKALAQQPVGNTKSEFDKVTLSFCGSPNQLFPKRNAFIVIQCYSCEVMHLNWAHYRGN